MSLFSNWKVTWDPATAAIVFLDYNQEIEGEIDFPWQQQHEERRVIEGDFTEPLPRGWVSGSISFIVWKEHADDLAAREYLRTHRAACHALRGLRKTLRITPLGGTNDDKANTMIKRADGRMMVMEDGTARTAFSYQFLGPW